MQKSKILLVASGALIAIGLVLSIIGNQIILEGVSQGNGKVNFEHSLEISTDFDVQKTSTGVYAVQIMEFKEGGFSAKVFDPSDIEIMSQEINDESVENQFEIFESGSYKLVIQSLNNEESHVFGAIGPLPDAGKKAFGFISIIVIIIGMAGLFGIGILQIKNRKN
ncbi:MAG: hypothetical protein ACE5DU_00770 [Nitrosopumilus sp.]